MMDSWHTATVKLSVVPSDRLDTEKVITNIWKVLETIPDSLDTTLHISERAISGGRDKKGAPQESTATDIRIAFKGERAETMKAKATLQNGLDRLGYADLTKDGPSL